MLTSTTGVLQRQSDGNVAHKVDVADVDEHLGRVESEFTEPKVDIVIWVCRVEDRRLDESWTGVDSEGQWRTNGEPYSATCDTWNCSIYCVPRSTKIYGNVGADSGAC